MTVAELINSAKGFSFDKLGANGILFRNNKGLENQSISIDLNMIYLLSLLTMIAFTYPLQKIFFLIESIEIKGEVNFPKELDFKYGLTITDLIIMSGGLTLMLTQKILEFLEIFLS